MTRITSGTRRLPGDLDLAPLHAAGRCPLPNELHGVMDGHTYGTLLPDQLRMWRGKLITSPPGEAVTGVNRIGFGLLEVRRFRFTAEVGLSLLSDRRVLVLDHDHPENPPWIRRFHDEVVRVRSGLLLATTHYRHRGELRHLGFFTLQPRGRTSGEQR